MLLASVEVLDKDDRRIADRLPVHHGSTVRTLDKLPLDVEVLDFSRTGLSFKSATSLPMGGQVSIGLAGAGVTPATIVRREGNVYGCAFDPPLSQAQAALAFCVSSAVQFQHSEAMLPPANPPHVVKWPVPVRFAALAAGAVGAWSMIALVVLH